MPAGTECPHTPVRCEHKWWTMFPDGPADGRATGPQHGPYDVMPQASRAGDVICCEECGNKQVAVTKWQQTRAAFGSQERKP